MADTVPVTHLALDGATLARSVAQWRPAEKDPPPPAPASRSYERVWRAVTETPWAILPHVYETIREVVALRMAGAPLSAEEIEDRISAGPGSKPPARAGAVAILPVYGVVFPRANLMMALSGGTSLEVLGAQIEAAAGDPQVGTILLDVNSPGGSVDLLPETAAKIRAARSRKRVVAIANTMAASAAYWLASQAEELVVTPSGMVGSVGVLAEHVDESGLLERAGLKVTLITAGRYKAEATPTEPLGDEARAHIQSIVDDFYGQFVGDIAKGRGASRAEVLAGYGEGRIFTAREASKRGMVDRVETLDALLARLARPSRPAASAAAEPAEPVGDASDTDVEQTDPAPAGDHEGLEHEADYALALARLRT